MDQLQTKRANTLHPLTKRSPAARTPIGGRFVAHGVAPSTFIPMPKPRKMSVDATAKPSGPRGVSVRLSNSQRNEEWQKRNKPSGFTVGQRCSWCFTPFDTQPDYSLHRSVCPNRPGGPETRPEAIGIHQTCDCGAEFPSNKAWRRHIGIECPLPDMCPVCGEWFSTRGDKLRHLFAMRWNLATCFREGAD